MGQMLLQKINNPKRIKKHNPALPYKHTRTRARVCACR